jgi:seryl-tRNA synthetase
MLFCTGDMGFASAKTYDLEVWLPGKMPIGKSALAPILKTFKRRRANIRFKPK